MRWRVWAPGHLTVEVVLPDRPRESFHLVWEATPGFFSGELRGAGPGLRYLLRLDETGGPYPDPWSRSQPEGVHGPSEVVVADFPWTDAGWKGVAPESLVLYEVHVGTATPEGTFEALIPRLRGLRALGVTALELMPVASFGGT
jgi:maltooligosyltrehalose trehalohydrolase